MNTSGKHVLLVGAGHAHLHLLQHARRIVETGARVTVVQPGTFWYSGLATGMLGGAHESRSDRVAVGRLAREHGAVHLNDRVVQADPGSRTVQLASGTTARYDLLSLNVGSETTTALELPSAPDATNFACTVKPLKNLWRLRVWLEKRFGEGRRGLRAVVVGGGLTGCEVAANLEALARRRKGTLAVTILHRAERLIEDRGPRAARSLSRYLVRRGIAVEGRWEVQRIEDKRIICADGRRFPWDVLVVATGLRAASLVQSVGLPCDGEHGLLVDDTLRSVADNDVFGAGDCIAFKPRPLPKVGVFGVRQAPVLLENIVARLHGKPLRRFRPQRRYLLIAHLGWKEGLALWGPLHWRGKLSLRLKDLLDQRFLAKYPRPDESEGAP